MSSSSMPFAAPRPKPDGDFRACPQCGMSGTLSRIVRWHGTTPERETYQCATCEGRGWLAAPYYYKLPHRQWPDGTGA